MLGRWNTSIAGIIAIGFYLLPLMSGLQISECPGKDVSEVRRQANEHELSLVFYHVAWCKESRTARSVFDQISQQYMDNAHFAMVDCYHLACNCSKTYPFAPGSGAPHKWPTLIIQYGHRISLQYNGEWEPAALRLFLNKLLRPVERVHNREELKSISMRSDAVVLGLFPHHANPEYRRFVSAAVKWAEIDSKNSFQFAVAFGPTALAILGGVNATIESLPLFLLVHSKGIDQAPTAEWNVSSIIYWVQAEFRRTFNQLYAYSAPKTLAAQLLNGPVLGIAANDYFYDYMCSLTNPERSVQLTRTPCPSSPIGREYTLWQDIQYVQYTFKRHTEALPKQSYAKQSVSRWHLRYYYGLNKYLKNLLCQVSPSCINTISLQNLYEFYEQTSCSITTHNCHRNPAAKITAAKYLKKFVDNQWHEFRNVHNRSLSICIFDSAKYIDFLDLQGITASKSNSATVFIIDSTKENTYLLNDQFRYDTLEKFIRNYYGDNLLAVQRSTSNHYGISSSSALHVRYISSVNREMFLNVVAEQNTTMVVLLHSPQCAFSALLSQALNQLSSMLDAASGIHIIRLNVQTDELPWEFAMASTPTLIVFPRGRAFDSRIFPMHLRADTRNVFGFILAQMDPVDQLKVIFSNCRRRVTHQTRLRKCLQYAKTLIAQHIASEPRLWQNFATERHHLLEQRKEFNYIVLEMKRHFGNF